MSKIQAIKIAENSSLNPPRKRPFLGRFLADLFLDFGFN